MLYFKAMGGAVVSAEMFLDELRQGKTAEAIPLKMQLVREAAVWKVLSLMGGKLPTRNEGMPKQNNDFSKTHFLNVDLDIYSRSDLQPIVQALGKNAIALYVGRERGGYSAHLEISKSAKTPDSTIRIFCELIQALPKPERDLWNAAGVRSFSIGIQAGRQPNPCDMTIRAETVQAVAELAAQIVITVYPSRPDTQADGPA